MRRSALILPTVAVAGLALLAGCSGGGSDSCLKGSWQPSDMSAMGADTIESMGGSFDFTMKFDGSTISFNMESKIPPVGGSEERTMEYTGSGKYSTSGGKMTIKDFSASAKVNGKEQTGGSGLGFTDAKDGQSTYTCSGDKLTIDGTDFTKK